MCRPNLGRAPREFGRGALWPVLAGLLIGSIAGCQIARFDPDAEGAIARATGLDRAISFLTEGAPLDEAWQSSGSLGLADAVERAVRGDPELQAALARVRVALADADQARLLPNPVLGIVLRWGPGKPQIEASLAQDLIDAIRAPRRTSAADHRLRQAAADALTVALDVVERTRSAYLEAQAADLRLPLLQSRLEALDRLAGIARDRLDAGEGVRGDVTTLQSQRVELEVDLAEARLEQTQSRLRLARLVGEPSGDAAWPLDPWLTDQAELNPGAAALSPGADAGPGEWIQAALEHRPEIQSIGWELAALGDDRALTALLPWEGTEGGIDVARDDAWFAGPSIQSAVPVFDAGQARRARVQAQTIEARHRLVAARRLVVQEVRLARAALDASVENLRRVREELIPLQNLRRQQAEEAYRAGLADVTALFIAEQDLLASEARALELERRARQARIDLERAAGGAVIAPAPRGGTDAQPTSPASSPADAEAPSASSLTPP